VRSRKVPTANALERSMEESRRVHLEEYFDSRVSTPDDFYDYGAEEDYETPNVTGKAATYEDWNICGRDIDGGVGVFGGGVKPKREEDVDPRIKKYMKQKQSVAQQNHALVLSSPVHQGRVNQPVGPGDYDLSHSLSFKSDDFRSQLSPVQLRRLEFGVKFSEAVVPSETDKLMARAKESPGPGSYSLPGVGDDIRGTIKFNESKAKSPVEWLQYYAAQIPGVGAYEVSMALDKNLPNAKPVGGKFNEGNAKSSLDWVEYNAKRIPGPGEYSLPSVGDPRSGVPVPALGKGPRGSYVEAMLAQKRQIPGPGSYNVGAAYKAGVEPGSMHRGESTFTSDTHEDALKHLLLEAARTPGAGQYYRDRTGEGLKGGKFNNSNAKTDVEWKMHEAAQLPGPGSYKLPSTVLGAKGVSKFSAGNELSELDKLMLRAKDLPGPAQYTKIESASDRLSGGKFNLSVVPSDTELMMAKAAKIPGPGRYNLGEAIDKTLVNAKPVGGKFNSGMAKSSLDWVEYRARQIPGPSDYEPKEKKPSGGAFSNAKPKSDLEWKIHVASQQPGPSDYVVKPERPSGGAFSTAKAKTDLEWRIHFAKQMPGPGAYEAAPSKPSGGTISKAPLSNIGLVEIAALRERDPGFKLKPGFVPE